MPQLLPDRGAARIFAAYSLIDSTGTGLWTTASVVFLTRSVGLSAGQVGLGLSVAGLVGFLGGVPLGHLADRRGAREVTLALAAAQGLVMAAYATVHAFWQFVLVACCFQFAQRGGNAVRNALVALTVPADQRVRVRAYLRAVQNVAFSVGALLAGVVLTVDSRTAYLLVVFGNAASFLVAAALLVKVPRAAPRPRPAGGERRRSALRDYPFLAVTVVSGLMSMHASVLTVAAPLWIIRHTSAPRALVAALLLVNTVLTILLQVPLARGAQTVPGAARMLRRAGMVVALSCLLYPLSTLHPTGLAIAILLVASAVLTVGELWQSAGGWGLSYDLAPSHALGAYQGVYALGNSFRDTFGPGLVTALAIGWGWQGWIVLAAGFAALGLLVGPVTRWATRGADGVRPAGRAAPATVRPAGAGEVESAPD
jgi:Major Facilitator Superfamily